MAGWFTPARLLLLFCCMSMLIYVDRGVMSSASVSGAPPTDGVAGSGLQGDFDISYYQYGLLQAAFMVGLLIGCPIFSVSAKAANPFRLMGVGLGLWTLATTGCALSPGYPVFFLCRMLVGAGEASFVTFAAPFIDDYAPPPRKTLWLAAFYLCIPFGVAGGFIYGGLIGAALGWRAAFAIESGLMLPVVAFCFISRPIPMRGVTKDTTAPQQQNATSAAAAPSAAGILDAEVSAYNDDTDALLSVSTAEPSPAPGEDDSRPGEQGMRGVPGFSGAMRAFAHDLSVLAGHPVYVMTLCSYTLYTAVIGVYAVWGPKAGYAIYKDVLHTRSAADLVLGFITVVAGVAGTVAGGLAVDRLGSSMPSALGVCAASAAVGFVLLEASFAAPTFGWFVVLFLFGEILAFVVQAPVNAVIMWSVPPGTRPLACSMTTVVIHLLGDVPTPPLFGLILERQGSSGGGGGASAADWRHTLEGFTLVMALSAATLALSVPVATRSKDYRKEEEVAGEEAEESVTARLLPLDEQAGDDNL